MLNNINDNISYKNKKSFLSLNTKEIIFGISALTWLILSLEVTANDSKNNIDYQIKRDIYEQMKNQFSFSANWFIKTIENNNLEQILNKNLIKHETKLIRLLKWNISNGVLCFNYNLSLENISAIKWAIESLVYLMDSMYWKWFSSILTDWKDHSDKHLTIDIMETEKGYKLREIIILDSTEEEIEKNSVEKIKTNSNSKIYKV